VSSDWDPTDREAIQARSRYVVGIDLGTTNSAAAYFDTHEMPRQLRTVEIPQVVAPFQIEGRQTLPSFHYQATATEAEAGALRLPWGDPPANYAVGTFARDEGITKPGRLIASAKSWLSHSGVDRTAELLPWQGDADVDRLSPVEASSRYLQHVGAAWDHQFPQHVLAEQDVVLTLPASFDEVARELTVDAARRAGLPRVTLIEEPQAAFYAWLERHEDDWQQQITPGQKILVCDIGGGTSDFTLIRVRPSEAAGDVQFHRIAVGEHLILGGDNLDLALARHIEHRLAGGERLSARQWDTLVRTSRRVKETLLSADSPESLTVNLPAAGSKVIGGGLQVEVSRSEVQELLVEGFLPRVALTDKPARRQSGFQDFGLPYAADPAMTRYLAAFLVAHRFTGDDSPDHHWQEMHKADPARPDVVLFNGGFFASPVLRERLVSVLSSWFSTPDRVWTPLVLDNQRLDLAVAQGAAYYGMVRRGEGVRIAATLARSYYIAVAGDTPRAVCLAPGNAIAGQDFEIRDREFQLALAEPVEFPLYVSSTRLVDPSGAVVDVDLEELTSLPPIRTVLHAGHKRHPQTVRVRLHAHLSEVGTLELSCREVDGNRSWRLQFDVRSTTQTDIAAHQSNAEREGFVDDTQIDACRELIERVFGPAANEQPGKLMKGLSEILQMDRHRWPTSVLRRIWEMLIELEAGRRKSPAHEGRWLNLLGYALRPGYGFAVDDWRVAQTWRAVNGKIVFPASQNEALVLWRRVAGGMSRGQQLSIAELSLPAVRALRRRFGGGKPTAAAPPLDPAQSAEVWRLLGSLELLPVSIKIELGDTLVELLPKRKLDKWRSTMFWALGRLGQRVPLYGPLNTLVPPAHAARWLQATMKLAVGDPVAPLAVMLLARRTDDRHRDIHLPLREHATKWLRDVGAASHLQELVRLGGTLDEEERGEVFGESLPSGLRMA
jgi:molecular chaperone DnaK (HSP70)